MASKFKVFLAPKFKVHFWLENWKSIFGVKIQSLALKKECKVGKVDHPLHYRKPNYELGIWMDSGVRSRAVITRPNMASFWTLQVFFYKTSRSFGACVKRSSSDALLCLASALVTKFFLFKISGNFLYLITFLELHFAFLAPTFWCYCTLQITVLENQQKVSFS